jgi:predicted Fe-Mo cluster-binding NifX family protein
VDLPLKSLVCIPTDTNDGWDAEVSAHFSSAPWFALVRGTEVEWLEVHADLECGERASLLAKREASIVLTRGASASNLLNLQAREILVLDCQAPTLRQAILSLMMGGVKPFESSSCCGKHDHEDGACAHNP